MAEEVGAAYVSLIPSARSFSRKAKEELAKAMRGVKDDAVTVPVKPEIDPVSAALRSELQNQMRAIARRLALEVPVSADSHGLRERLQSQLDGIRSTLAMQVPTEPGDADKYRRSLRGLLDHVRSTEHQEVDVDVDVDKNKSLFSRMQSAGQSLASSLLGRFGSALMNPIIGIPALILASIAGPAAGALTAGAVLAGGGLAGVLVGAFALRADEDLKKALTGLGHEIDSTLTDAAKPLKGPFLEAIKIIGAAFKDIAPDIKGFFKTLAPEIPKLAQGFGGFLRSFSETGAIDKFAKALGPALDQLAMALPDIGNALSQFLISMSEAGPTGARVFGMTLRGIADIIRFLGDAIVWLTNRFNDVGAAMNWVKERIKDLGAGILTGILALGGYGPAIDSVKQAISNAGHDIAEIWRSLWDGMSTKVSSTVDSVVAFARGLPAKISSAVGNLDNLLYDAGRKVVQGLISGIRSKLGDLAGVAAVVAGTISRFLPHSPAKEGPLSGSGSPYTSGQSIAAGLAAGVQSELPMVTSAADELASVFGPGGPGAAGGASMRSMQAIVQIDGTGLPDALNEWLMHNTRVKSPDGTTDGAYAAA